MNLLIRVLPPLLSAAAAIALPDPLRWAMFGLVAAVVVLFILVVVVAVFGTGNRGKNARSVLRLAVTRSSRASGRK